MTFVEKVRYKTDFENIDIRTAVMTAMDECMKDDILVDFFEEHRAEVIEVSIYDYDEEKVRKILAEEAKEEGREKGRQEGREEGKKEGEKLAKINLVIKKVKRGKPLSIIASVSILLRPSCSFLASTFNKSFKFIKSPLYYYNYF